MLELSKLLQILGFCVFSASAADRVSVTQQELTEKLKNYSSITHLKANFKQTKTFKDMSLKLNAEGVLELSPPENVTWTITKPSYVLVQMNKDNFILGSGTGKNYIEQKIKLSEVNEDQRKNLTELVAWLEMNPEKLYAQYEIFKTKNRYIFYPKKTTSNPFKSLSMILDSIGNLKELTIDESSGDTLKIEFAKPEIKRK